MTRPFLTLAMILALPASPGWAQTKPPTDQAAPDRSEGGDFERAPSQEQDGYVPSVPAPTGQREQSESAPSEEQQAEQGQTTQAPAQPPQSGLFGGQLLIQPSGLTYGLASSADPRATEVGMEILREGGSATDAAMAIMLALTVVEPQSSGIGGGGFLLHAAGVDGAITTIDGREKAPAAADAGRFLAPDGTPMRFLDAFPGGKAVGVPGNIRLMAMAHDKWGKLPWARLFEPAIQLADGGFDVSATLEQRLARIAPLWDKFPAAREIYWPSGAPAKEGELIRNPVLAETFERIAELGPEAFYSGRTAQEMVNKVTTAPVNPGDLTLDDLNAYRAVERPAICMPYREYRICGMGPPSSGATTVLQIVGMLQAFDLEKLGAADPQSWHLIHEAMRLAYADREKYLGDPDYVEVPVEGLLDPKYLAKRAALISPETSLETYEAGTPPEAQPRTPAPSSEVPGTSHFVTVDKDGNVVSMTSTVEGAFGSQLIAAGFFLNNELTDFTFAPEKDGAPVANRVAGSKRPLSSMSPTIVYDSGGRPVLALGSAGGKRIIMHVAKTLIGFIDWDLSLQQAIALPNIYYGGDGVLVEAGTLLADMAPGIAAFGRPVVASDLGSKVNGASWTEEGWVGAADPRSEGTAEAE